MNGQQPAIQLVADIERLQKQLQELHQRVVSQAEPSDESIGSGPDAEMVIRGR